MKHMNMIVRALHAKLTDRFRLENEISNHKHMPKHISAASYMGWLNTTDVYLAGLLKNALCLVAFMIIGDRRV